MEYSKEELWDCARKTKTCHNCKANGGTSSVYCPYLYKVGSYVACLLQDGMYEVDNQKEMSR